MSNFKLKQNGEQVQKAIDYALQVPQLSEAIADYEAELGGKLPKNQGAANVGKILVVGTDGNLVLMDMPEGGASGDVTGVLDDSNNILLTGNLADGTYTLKYKNEDGTYTEIGTLEVGVIEPDTPTYTNQLPLSVDANGNDFVGTHANGGDGYEYGYRISKSSGAQSAQDGVYCSGFIPATLNDTIRIKGISAAATDTHNVIAFYDSSKTYVTGLYNLADNNHLTIDGDLYTIKPYASLSSAFAFFRFSCGSITDNTIVTVNQEIV